MKAYQPRYDNHIKPKFSFHERFFFDKLSKWNIYHIKYQITSYFSFPRKGFLQLIKLLSYISNFFLSPKRFLFLNQLILYSIQLPLLYKPNLATRHRLLTSVQRYNREFHTITLIISSWFYHVRNLTSLNYLIKWQKFNSSYTTAIADAKLKKITEPGKFVYYNKSYLLFGVLE